MSGMGRVADETHRTNEVAGVDIAEARSVHGEVQSKVPLLTARVDASTAHVVEILLGCVQEVARTQKRRCHALLRQ